MFALVALSHSPQSSSAAGGKCPTFLLGARARLPVCLATQGEEIAELWPFLLTAIVGTIIGTVAGEHILRRLPETLYRRLVAESSAWELPARCLRGGGLGWKQVIDDIWLPTKRARYDSMYSPSSFETLGQTDESDET